MNKVTILATRPASSKQECFYCLEPIGGNHKSSCLLIKKKVKIRMTVEYEVEVPSDWDKNLIEFHRNDGSWCANNAIKELSKISEDCGCICHITHFEYLGDTGKSFLQEN